MLQAAIYPVCSLQSSAGPEVHISILALLHRPATSRGSQRMLATNTFDELIPLRRVAFLDLARYAI